MLKKYLVLLFLPLSVLAQPVVNSGGQTSTDGTLSYTIGETFAYFSDLSDAGLLTEFEKDFESKINIDTQNIEVKMNNKRNEISVSVNPCYNYKGLFYSIYSSLGICYLKKSIIVPDFQINYLGFPRGLLIFVISDSKKIIQSQKFML